MSVLFHAPYDTSLPWGTSNLNLAYHVFAGQIAFWGMFLLLLLYFFTYFPEVKTTKRLTHFDLLIAMTITTLYMSYHEGILFVLVPAFIYGVFCLFTRTFVSYFLMWSRIGFIVLLTGAPTVINATIFDFFQASLIDAPIGWERFRAQSPFADIFEMAGMHSLHTSPPFLWALSIPASIATGVIFLVGYIRSRMKVLIICYVSLFILMLFWSSVLHDNFFVYNRIVTYMLPFLLVIFTIGMAYIVSIKKSLGYGLVILFVGLNLYYGMSLLKKFMNNHLSVDRSLVSLQELNSEQFIKEPIYLDQVVLPQMYYWRMIWMEYFLYPHKNIISLGNYEEKNRLKDGDLLLVQNSHFAYPPPKMVLKPVVWDNGYFKVGAVCLSDECLIKNDIPLSSVQMGISDYEDTMLVRGWAANEGDHRWANAKNASVRMRIPDTGAATLIFEARSLQLPQTVNIVADGITVGSITLKKEWDIYTVPYPQALGKGMAHITFSFSNAYKPSEVLGNTDTRELYADFRSISLE